MNYQGLILKIQYNRPRYRKIEAQRPNCAYVGIIPSYCTSSAPLGPKYGPQRPPYCSSYVNRVHLDARVKNMFKSYDDIRE